MTKTKEELKKERSWLGKAANRLHPDFKARFEAFNKEVDIYNKALDEQARKDIKNLKVGDIVHLKENSKYKGLWRVEKIMQKNILIKSMGDGHRTPRLRCPANLVIKVEGEDESLVNSLDLIGLI